MTTTFRVLVGQNNDETLQATVTNHDSIPEDQVYDITGMQLDFYIKTSQNTPDSDSSTVHLSTTGGQIVLTNPTQGIAQITVPRANLQSSGTLWWRLDVTSAGKTRTAGNGPFTVIAQ